MIIPSRVQTLTVSLSPLKLSLYRPQFFRQICVKPGLKRWVLDGLFSNGFLSSFETRLNYSWSKEIEVRTRGRTTQRTETHVTTWLWSNEFKYLFNSSLSYDIYCCGFWDLYYTLKFYYNWSNFYLFCITIRCDNDLVSLKTLFDWGGLFTFDNKLAPFCFASSLTKLRNYRIIPLW